MQKFKHFLNHFEENTIMILLPLMCVLVFAATVCRYTGIAYDLDGTLGRISVLPA